MNPIGAPFVNAVSVDGPVVKPEKAVDGETGGFDVLLHPQPEKRNGSIPQKKAVSDGTGEESDPPKDQSDESDPKASNPAGMNLLASYLLAMQPAQAVPRAVTSAVAGPVVDNATTVAGSASGKATTVVGTVLANATPFTGAVLGKTPTVKGPVAGKAMPRAKSVSGKAMAVAVPVTRNAPTVAVPVTGNASAAAAPVTGDAPAVAGAVTGDAPAAAAPVTGDTPAVAGNAPVVAGPVAGNMPTVAGRTLRNATAIAEPASENVAIVTGATSENENLTPVAASALGDTATVTEASSENAPTVAGLVLRHAKAMPRPASENATDGEGEGLTVETPSETAHPADSLPTAGNSVTAWQNAAPLAMGAGQARDRKTTDDLLPAEDASLPDGLSVVADEKAIVPGSGPLSEKIADSAATIPLPAGVAKYVESAKIAGKAVVSEGNEGTSVEKDEQSTAQSVIQSTTGMSGAVQHGSMSAAHPQLAKNTPPPTEDAATLPSTPAVQGDAHQSAIPVSRELSHEGNAAPSAGTDAFEPAPFLSATQDTPSAGNLQPEAAAKTASTPDTSSILHHTLEAAERMHSDGRSNVEIQVRLRDGQELTIQLRMNAGECHPVFKTESADLRAALQQNWNQFSSNSADRGVRIAAPVFESSQSGMGDFQQRQEHPSQQQSPLLSGDEFQRPGQPKPRAAANRPDAGIPAEPSSLSLFA